MCFDEREAEPNYTSPIEPKYPSESVYAEAVALVVFAWFVNITEEISQRKGVCGVSLVPPPTTAMTGQVSLGSDLVMTQPPRMGSKTSARTYKWRQYGMYC